MLGVVAGCILVAGAVARRREGLGGVAALLLGLLAGSALVVLAAKALLPVRSNPAGGGTLGLVSADASWLWMTWKRSKPDSYLYGTPTLWLNLHLVVSLAVLALLGIASRGGRFWLIASLPVFVDLAIPTTWVDDVRIPFDSGASTLHLLVSTLAMHAERRLIPLPLCLALAAGHGLAWLAGEVRRRRGRATAAVVVALAFAAWGTESVLLGPVRLPVASFEPYSPPHGAYLAARGWGAVVDMPLVFQRTPDGVLTHDDEEEVAIVKAVRSRYLFDQTVHGLPILAAIGSRMPLEVHDLPFQDPLLPSLSVLGTTIQGRRFAVPPGWTPDALRTAGFRWVVLHRDLVVAEAEARIEAELRRVLGEPVAFGSVLVFEIPPTPGTASGR